MITNSVSYVEQHNSVYCSRKCRVQDWAAKVTILPPQWAEGLGGGRLTFYKVLFRLKTCVLTLEVVSCLRLMPVWSEMLVLPEIDSCGRFERRKRSAVDVNVAWKHDWSHLLPLQNSHPHTLSQFDRLFLRSFLTILRFSLFKCVCTDMLLFGKGN